MELHLSRTPLLVFILLCGGAGWGWSEHQTPRQRSLRVPADSEFRIAVFADLHYGENAWTDWGPDQDSKSDAVISSVLDAENPDLVIYLGDVITANNIPVANASIYWDRALSHTRTRGIPWACVFGNHDDKPFEWPSEWFSSTGVPRIHCPPENSSDSGCTMWFEYACINIWVGQECGFKGTTRLELMTSELEHNTLSFSMVGPRDLWPSISNYILQVTSSKCENTPVAFLYFLDSGGGSYPEVISSAQATWFQTLSEEINPHSRIPEIVFWHIPSLAYKNAAPSRVVGIREPCIGSINDEAVSAQEAEWGIMDIISERQTVKAVFVGHNHGLDWCCPSKSLWLCFARHSGYGGYGHWPRGSRIIEFTENPFLLRTWIRMKDGSTHSHIDLSS